jgi:hypothetical protein
MRMTGKWAMGLAVAAALSVALVSAAGAAPAKKKAAPKPGELSLLGVKLYDPVMVVLKKFGNPDRITPIGAPLDLGGGGGAPAGGGAPSGPRASAPPGAPNPGGPPGAPSASSSSNTNSMSLGPAPGVSPTPGSGLGPGMPSGGGGATGEARQVVYLYQKKGVTYMFFINEQGRVVQIASIADKDPNTRTRKGITLGSTYTQIIKTYGYPAKHEFSGTTMLLNYLRKDHVVFQLLGQKVVGISIAAGER